MRAIGLSIVVLIVAPIVGVLVWWASQTPAYTHRFRLVIEVEAGGALRTGASVIEVHTINYKVGLPQTTGLRSFVRGEAVFVDLGRGRNVIAILGFGPTGGADSPGLAQSAFLPRHPGLKLEDLPQLTGMAPLTGRSIPTLVTFADLDDPKTARVVRPEEFEQVFGPGVRFQCAFIEMVPAGTWPFNALGWPRSMAGEPVTRGIEKKLPWLLHVARYRTDPTNPFSNTLPIGRARFIREQ